MPVTFFHAGIGLLCKGIARERFSFTLFCLGQAAIDLEPGYYLLKGQPPFHRFFHTLLGATIVVAVATVALRPVAQAFLRWVQRGWPGGGPRWMDLAPVISWPVALATGALSILGHVVPDAMMHREARPFAPLAQINPFSGCASVGMLHLGLVAAGVVGLVLMLLRSRLARAAVLVDRERRDGP